MNKIRTSLDNYQDDKRQSIFFKDEQMESSKNERLYEIWAQNYKIEEISQVVQDQRDMMQGVSKFQQMMDNQGVDIQTLKISG